ncbi:hypothetical protein [Burkholderia pseudomallei]|uniref:hypothetical protein n=1 Tax=Burkholderia pseudomallei TaxID=28450 RepID=UPI0012F47AA2|nr:hypothetical protein [Burkholderia pseudomallei]
MKVKVKDLSAEIELKNNGIELEIRNNTDNFLGDLIVTKSSVIWCAGKTKRRNGVKMSLQAFIDYMNGHAPTRKRAVKKAAVKKAAVKKAAGR